MSFWELVEKWTGHHRHVWEVIDKWIEFDTDAVYTRYKCRCGIIARHYNYGRFIVEPKGLRPGVSECFWRCKRSYIGEQTNEVLQHQEDATDDPPRG